MGCWRVDAREWGAKEDSAGTRVFTSATDPVSIVKPDAGCSRAVRTRRFDAYFFSICYLAGSDELVVCRLDVVCCNRVDHAMIDSGFNALYEVGCIRFCQVVLVEIDVVCFKFASQRI